MRKPASKTPALDEARASRRTTRPRLLPPGEAGAGTRVGDALVFASAYEASLRTCGSVEASPACAIDVKRHYWSNANRGADSA